MNPKFNNPGNIRQAPYKWQGEIDKPSQNTFVEFSTPEYGYRALFKLLFNYIDSDYDTIAKIITRWAPESDNNPTASYMQYIENATGIALDKVLTRDNLTEILAIGTQISRFEQGFTGEPSQIREGLNMAINVSNDEIEDIPNFSAALFIFLTALGILYIKKRR